MKPKRVTSGTQPERFKITPLGNGRFDVQISENIEETTVTRRQHGENEGNKETLAYKHDLYMAVVKADDYGSLIAGIIHIKHSLDDESALINKGIADKENAEYKEYREFVSAVKEQAAQYFENK